MDPLEVPDYRERLALAHNNLGEAFVRLGDPAAAADELRKALESYEALAADHPGARDYLDGVAVSHNNRGGVLVDLGDRAAAANEFRKALKGYTALAAAHPNVPEYSGGVALAHLHLGGTLGDLGDRAGAADELREALKRYAPLAAAHPEVSEYSHAEGVARRLLSEILRELGKPDEEIASLREAVRLNPKSAASRYNLAIYLANQSKMDEAIDEFRETMHLDGDHVGSAAFNLGVELRQVGRYQEALELFRDLPKRVLDDQVYSERDKVKLIRRAEAELTETERSARLSALIRGDDKPKDAAEGLTFAYLALQAKRFRPSARLYAGAFQTDPKLAEDMTDHDRYNAACAAALAAAGKGDDKPPLSEPEARTVAEAGDRMAQGGSRALDQTGQVRSAPDGLVGEGNSRSLEGRQRPGCHPR